MQRDCLTTGSDAETPTSLGNQSGSSSLEETFTAGTTGLLTFASLKRKTEVRTRDFHKHRPRAAAFSVAASHLGPPLS